MSASTRPLSVEEFLAWERAQESRYEFDGENPIAVNGGPVRHARLIAKAIVAAGKRVALPFHVCSSGLKIVTSTRVRYPDVTIVRDPIDWDSDTIQPTVAFEVLSPATEHTDRHVKPIEYHGVASIQAYVIVSQEPLEVIVFRRSSGWVEEVLVDQEDSLDLPEVGIRIPLRDFYPTR